MITYQLQPSSTLAAPLELTSPSLAAYSAAKAGLLRKAGRYTCREMYSRSHISHASEHEKQRILTPQIH